MIRVCSLFKKFLASLIIVLVFIAVLTNSLMKGADASELNARMHKSVAATLAGDEFGNYVPEELITETINLAQACSTTPETYLNHLEILKNRPKITTNTVPLDTIDQTCLTKDQAIIKSTAILTQEGKAERTDISNYIVRPGDTISSIAQNFGISVNTVLWANNLTSYSLLHEGDNLKILPMSGVLHKVVSGDNIKKLADKYGVTTDKIILANHLDNNSLLVIGQEIMIPDGQKISSGVSATGIAATKTYRTIEVIKDLVKPNNAVSSNTKMQWPTVGYRITQYYSWRHTGLDIGNKTGTPLYAAEAGIVETAGWNSGGYGYMILINHGNGVKTRYAHASKLYVSKGDKVVRGETIAAMGSTGRSTGPHIHFEVIINGAKVNPLNYIR